ncbi:AB hydrolase-1 domain-containing protein [Mycena chlorophos]|uniref:AB hydrolase-1 domain-containing protein n=1 Tax=Mycena chlorophos TaxID=658473 RepID=A0A8H6SLH8_MYCCL|nr:AB hydrolase-1 domain-containing protein [Mycena chlorophos]
MSSLRVDSLVFDCPQNAREAPGERLKMAVKRYSRETTPQASAGLTLLFAHCVGAHKEAWEPAIERIFALAGAGVNEAYAFDWQTHGDSAVLNRQLLDPETRAGRVDGVSVREWAEAIAAFVRSPALQGKRIVAIGHSAGAGAMLLSTKHLPSPPPYQTVIVVEPTAIPGEMFYRELDYRISTMEFVVSATLARRETWKSRDVAFAWMRKRVPWVEWDERVVKAFVDHGLETTPDGQVRIKGDRRHEALCYPDPIPHFEAADLLATTPAVTGRTHFVWAEAENVLVPRDVRDALIVGAASVSGVKGGHLIVQENPDGVAATICTILERLAQPKSRL